MANTETVKAKKKGKKEERKRWGLGLPEDWATKADLGGVAHPAKGEGVMIVRAAVGAPPSTMVVCVRWQDWTDRHTGLSCSWEDACELEYR